MVLTTFLVLGFCLLAPFSVSASNPEAVSLLQLIATPEKYDGKLVRVMGFMHLEFEGNGLYLHQEDYERALSKNGVWLSHAGTKEVMALNNHYVLIEGIFDAKNSGHFGMWSGSLKEISRVMAWGEKHQERAVPASIDLRKKADTRNFARYVPFGDGREVIVRRGQEMGLNYGLEKSQRTSKVKNREFVLVRYQQQLSPPSLQAGQKPLSAEAAKTFIPESEVLRLPEAEVLFKREPNGFSEKEIDQILAVISFE